MIDIIILIGHKYMLAQVITVCLSGWFCMFCWFRYTRSNNKGTLKLITVWAMTILYMSYGILFILAYIFSNWVIFIRLGKSWSGWDVFSYFFDIFAICFLASMYFALWGNFFKDLKNIKSEKMMPKSD